jgi:hypothetical protein
MGLNPHGIPAIIETPTIETSEERLRVIDQARNEAISAHKLAQERMKHRIKSTFKPFSVNQKVWLDSRNLKLSYPSRKIAPKREGPYKIKRVMSPLTYELELPQKWKIYPVFHATLLSPYQENDVHGSNENNPTPDVIDNEEEYEVEGVINHRTRDNQTQYLIKWKNFSHEDNEWLTEKELAPHALKLLNEYRKMKQIAPFNRKWNITQGRIKIGPINSK